MFFIERIDKPLEQHCLIINILHSMKQACLEGKQSEERHTEKQKGDRQRETEGVEGGEDT